MIANIILEGTFSADREDGLGASRVRAIRLVEEIGERLISESPEIADFYRSNPEMNYLEIAERFIPGEAESFPRVAESSVGYALRALIPGDEIREMARARKETQLTDIHGDFDSERFKEHCRKAAKRRHELRGVDADAMTRGRGFIPWSSEERKYTLRKLKHGASYGEAAREVNQEFHEGESVRSDKNTYDMARYEARRKNK